MTRYNIFTTDGAVAGFIELFPVEEETENGSEIVYGVKRKCQFCGAEDTKQMWKCCPEHCTSDGPDVVCDECYNKPDHGSVINVIDPAKFEDPILCSWATEDKI